MIVRLAYAFLLVLLLPEACQAEIMVRSVRADSVQPGGRCWFWFPKGLHSYDLENYNWNNPVTVPAGWRWTFPARSNDGQAWSWQWAVCIHVPVSAAPGVYNLPTGVPGEPPLQVTVVASPPKRPIFRASPSDPRQEIQSRLNAGYDVELLPGIYTWDSWLDVPSGASIVSSGAKLVRHWNGDEGTFKRLFQPLGTFTLSGVTLTHDESVSAEGYENIQYIHAFPFPPGQLTVQDVTVERGSLVSNWGQKGAVIERCKFNRSGLGHLPDNCVVRDCDFIGRGATGQHSLINNSSNDSLLVSLRFNGTTRGPIFQNHYATGCCVLDIDCRGIRGGDGYGAGECLLLETPFAAMNPPTSSMVDNVFLDYRVSDSSGPGISLYGDGIRNNKFLNFDLHVDGHAILLASLSEGGVLGRNEFSNVETTGWIEMHGAQEPQAFDNLAMLQTIPMRSNQGPWNIYKAVNNSWPFVSTLDPSIEHEFTGFSKLVTPDAILPLRSVNQFQTTTTDTIEKTLYWLPVGWDYSENSGEEAYWCEYVVTAFDTADKTRTASFSRRCKITRVANNPATIEDSENGPTFAPAGWLVRNHNGNDRLDIRVQGEAGVKWKLQSIKWKRIY